MTQREIKKLAREIDRGVSKGTSGSEHIRSMKRRLASLGLPFKPVCIPYKRQKERWAEDKRLREEAAETGALRRLRKREKQKRKKV